MKHIWLTVLILSTYGQTFRTYFLYAPICKADGSLHTLNQSPLRFFSIHPESPTARCVFIMSEPLTTNCFSVRPEPLTASCLSIRLELPTARCHSLYVSGHSPTDVSLFIGRHSPPDISLYIESHSSSLVPPPYRGEEV